MVNDSERARSIDQGVRQGRGAGRRRMPAGPACLNTQERLRAPVSQLKIH